MLAVHFQAGNGTLLKKMFHSPGNVAIDLQPRLQTGQIGIGLRRIDADPVAFFLRRFLT